MTIDSKPVFGKVALIGIGLIGSSLAHAIKRGGLAAHVAGYDERSRDAREGAARSALRIRCTTRSQPAVRDADLVILATPVGAFGALAKEMSAGSEARRDPERCGLGQDGGRARCRAVRARSMCI